MTDPAPNGRAAGARGDEALRRSEERYRALVEATSQVVWSWSPEAGSGEFAQTQQWWERITGQSIEDQSRSSTGWLDVVHPDDREAARAAWSTALASGVNYEIEYRVRERGDGWRHVHARGVPIRNTDGSVREWVGTLDDVTERRRAETELRQSEHRFRRLASAGIIGVIRWDLDRSLILDANDEFLRMTGYARADLAAGRLNFRTMTPPEWATRNEAGIRDLRETGVGGSYEKEYFRKDGSRVPVIIVGVRFEDAPGEGMSFVMDITDRKRAEHELGEREELLRLATQAAELGIWVWDPATDHVVWENTRPYEIFGLDPSSGPVNASRFLTDFVHPDDAAAFQGALTGAVRTRTRFYFLGRMRRTDGDVRWVEFTGLPVQSAAAPPSDARNRRRRHRGQAGRGREPPAAPGGRGRAAAVGRRVPARPVVHGRADGTGARVRARQRPLPRPAGGAATSSACRSARRTPRWAARGTSTSSTACSGPASPTSVWASGSFSTGAGCWKSGCSISSTSRSATRTGPCPASSSRGSI